MEAVYFSLTSQKTILFLNTIIFLHLVNFDLIRSPHLVVSETSELPKLAL
jgi:hypothetical protein